MTGLHATLRRSGGLDALSRRLAMPPADVASAAGRLLPPLLARYRRVFELVGGAEAGIRAIATLTAPFGGGKIAMTILAGGAIAPEAESGLLAAVLAPSESADTLIAEACPSSAVGFQQLAAVLPALNLLVGGYLTARAEADGDDIVADFAKMLGTD